ncbi:MAG: Holliday junction branch migration protein RuvA [Ornithinimicrobium sp.]
MIASIRGVVAKVGLDHLLVEVGGVGLRVLTTPATAASHHTGSQVHLHTSMVVREESLTLYGFADENARLLFEQVQTVSGVGPRLAQAMLSVHDPNTVRHAISSGDLVALTKVPGIGRKGAERIVLELKDKIIVLPGDHHVAVSEGGEGSGSGDSHPESDQVVQALVGLGWNTKQAEQAVHTVQKSGPASADSGSQQTTSVAALLRAALRELGR